LVAGPLLLEPGQHVGVDTQGYGLLDRPVQGADVRNQIMPRFPSDAEAFSVPIFRPFVTLVCRIICQYMYRTAHINLRYKIFHGEHFKASKRSSPMQPMCFAANIEAASRKRMRSGDRPGLQNRRSSSFGGDGGFDSHSLPPFFNNLQTTKSLRNQFVPERARRTTLL
jgi:hypothetical protein